MTKFTFTVRKLDNGLVLRAHNPMNDQWTTMTHPYTGYTPKTHMVFEYLEEHKDKAPEEALKALLREIESFIKDNGGLA